MSKEEAKGQVYQAYKTENKESLMLLANCKKKRKPKFWQKWKEHEDKSKS